MNLFKEFKPAFLFLGKFLAIYFIGNLLYGLFVEAYGSRPDPATIEITRQTSTLLNLYGLDTHIENHPSRPTVILHDEGLGVVSVFEGCNGINVMIVFVAFLFAFGGRSLHLLLFLSVGLMIIHLANILRLILLFFLAKDNSPQFYYYHKYFFTAILYMVVFALWYVWATQFNKKHPAQ